MMRSHLTKGDIYKERLDNSQRKQIHTTSTATAVAYYNKIFFSWF